MEPLRYDELFRNSQAGHTVRTMATTPRDAGPDRRPRRPHPQPQERRPDAAAPLAGRDDRGQRLGQVVARLRHHLRRGAAALRRVAVGLRPAVPRADGEAGRRLDRGHLPGDRHPPEEQHPQSRARRSARPPRSTTTCACSTPGSAAPICRNCGREVDARDRRGRGRGGSATLPRGHPAADRLRHAGRHVDAPLAPVSERGRRGAGVARRRPRTEAPPPQPDLPGSGRPGRRDARRAAPQGLRPALCRRPDGRRSRTSTRRRCKDRPLAAGDRRSPEGRRRPARAADRLDRDRLHRRRRRRVRHRAGRRPAGRRSSTASASGSSAAPCNIQYEVPQPRLFSFNNPFGACPLCHGFGNIIELDMDLVVPDPSKSIQQNAIEPWSKPHYRAQLAELKRAAQGPGAARRAVGRADRRREAVRHRGGRRAASRA